MRERNNLENCTGYLRITKKLCYVLGLCNKFDINALPYNIPATNVGFRWAALELR